MLKFIIALLFAQVLLAAPLPEVCDVICEQKKQEQLDATYPTDQK